MSRRARVVVPGLPHHVTQRGNRKLPTFFTDEDKREYLRILKDQTLRYGVKIWAYSLMENHVHFLAIPESTDSLSKAFGQTHWHYTRRINFREDWKGYLWQGRFSSYVVDESHLYAVVRYIENNPVKAGIVQRAEDYPWSSARAHLYRINDPLLSHFYLLDNITAWSEYLRSCESEKEGIMLDSHIRTGRPLGSQEFVLRLENLTRRVLRKLKPGPKPLEHSSRNSGDTHLIL